MNTSIIPVSYSDTISVNFTNDAWFNATEVAKHFDKRPVDWLKLDCTKEYITALEKFIDLAKCGKITSVENQLVRTEKGGINGGGGSWFHPKLAIAFARWLDVKFAIWCDMQIEKILHPVQQPLDEFNTRLIISFEQGKAVSSSIIPSDACVISPKNPGALKTMIREFVPVELLPVVIESANQRMMTMFQPCIDDRNKAASVIEAPTPVSAPVVTKHPTIPRTRVLTNDSLTAWLKEQLDDNLNIIQDHALAQMNGYILISKAVCYDLYRHWALKKQLRPVANNIFGRMLKQYDIQSIRSRSFDRQTGFSFPPKDQLRQFIA